MKTALRKRAKAVDRLARLTGMRSVPELKQTLGYSYEPDKFGVAGVTPVASQTVAAPRVLECPIQLEAVVAARHGIMDDDPQVAGLISAFEVRITRVHVHPSLRRQQTGCRHSLPSRRPQRRRALRLCLGCRAQAKTARYGEGSMAAARFEEFDRTASAGAEPPSFCWRSRPTMTVLTMTVLLSSDWGVTVQERPSSLA